MGNLMEVVFEEVPKNYVWKLLSMLIANMGKILEIKSSEKMGVSRGVIVSEGDISEFLEFNGDAIVLFTITDMILDGILIPNIQLRLLKYDKRFDIDFDFSEAEIVNLKEFVCKLHNYVKVASISCNVTAYYAGMEPASDEDTRYFTGESLGPLMCD